MFSGSPTFSGFPTVTKLEPKTFPVTNSYKHRNVLWFFHILRFIQTDLYYIQAGSYKSLKFPTLSLTSSNLYICREQVILRE
jgi:hypothetical protein